MAFGLPPPPPLVTPAGLGRRPAAPAGPCTPRREGVPARGGGALLRSRRRRCRPVGRPPLVVASAAPAGGDGGGGGGGGGGPPDDDWRAFRARLVAAELAPPPTGAATTPSTAAAAGSPTGVAPLPPLPSPADNWAHPLATPEAGCLLVATPGGHPPRSYFAHSVVLLLHAGPDGAAGVLLGRSATGARARAVEALSRGGGRGEGRRGTDGADRGGDPGDTGGSSGPRPIHRLCAYEGGPVGRSSVALLLHDVAGVTGSESILPGLYVGGGGGGDGDGEAPTDGSVGDAGGDHGRGGGGGGGGSGGATGVAAAVAAVCAAAGPPTAADADAATAARLRLHLGYCGWSAGQLEGELQSGAWFVAAAGKGVVFGSTAGGVTVGSSADASGGEDDDGDGNDDGVGIDGVGSRARREADWLASVRGGRRLWEEVLCRMGGPYKGIVEDAHEQEWKQQWEEGGGGE